MGDVEERSRLKSECETISTEQTEMVNYPQLPKCIGDEEDEEVAAAEEDEELVKTGEENHDEESISITEEDILTTTKPPATSSICCTTSSDTNPQRKRKKSECGDDFLGFKKHCIDEATDVYRKCLKYNSALSTNNFDMKTDNLMMNGFDENLRQSSSSTKSEYAQYLGLQPTVKFKCIKCATTNFPTLTALNKHLEKCPESCPTTTTTTTNPDESSTSSSTSVSNSTNSTSSTTNFKITRRVYLCSACGVYFEIWKLFLHMRTAHRRYICLICLGLFSIAEKLSNHLIVKHNILAKNYDNLTNFFNDFTGQNFIMCCQCEKMFTEKDNFVGHVCEMNGNSTPPVIMKKIQQKPSSSTPNNNNGGSKSTMSIFNKLNTSSVSKLKNKILPSEHVTADTPSEHSENDTETIPPPSEIVEDDHESKASIPPPPEIKIEEEIEEPTIITSPKPDETLPVVTTVNVDDDKPKIDEEEEKCVEDLNETETKNEVEMMSTTSSPEQRRVPKVTLKIPPKSISESEEVDEKGDTDTDSDDDSLKLTMEVDEKIEEDVTKTPEETFPIADTDIPIVELGLRPSLDKITIQSLLKDFIRATCYTCVYCNYARKIAVNGKQLGLHMIAEHRFSATADSITAEELLPETFVKRIKDDFDALQLMYFNLESYDNTDPSTMIPYDRTYECFQCRFVTTVHKELYLHNRKMHQKTLLLCIMCKSTFYSYSELLCHLCPGVYLGDVNILFRCCLCPIDNVASAFRLMVHLRKRHHACDVCLETCNSQSKLSNHVWKHKLHHLCYRCGIAYRNKPDITKHLFWKHGTESVLCKKCLQKKWPHVYHFCIPPQNFICEECNKVFLKAVALKVHKRLHSNVKPYVCTESECSEAFISKKLLGKHLLAHKEPIMMIMPPSLEEQTPLDDDDQEEPSHGVSTPPTQVHTEEHSTGETKVEENLDESKIIKPVVDVLDLPALNLSESDSSDSEDDVVKTKPEVSSKDDETPTILPVEVEKSTPIVIENIWDNFKNYQASVGKRNLSPGGINEEDVVDGGYEKSNLSILIDVIMNDHDYCAIDGDETRITGEGDDEKGKIEELKTEKDHSYCDPPQSDQIVDKKATSDSSSDSDSSSCSCGSNCSCSSSSSNGSSSSSSSSSDSDSSSSDAAGGGAEQRRTAAAARNAERKQKRKERAKSKKKISETSSNIDVVHVEDGITQPVMTAAVAPPIVIPDIPIYESDLFTDESETDEDFYDECPQLLAKKLIEEKKNQLLLDMGGPPLSAINGTSFLETSRSSTPNLPVDEQQLMIKIKKPKNKSKKRKKSSQKKSSSPRAGGGGGGDILPPLKLNIPHSYFRSSPLPQNTTPSTPQVITTTTSQSQIPPTALTTISTPVSSSSLLYNSNTGSGSETDSALRLSKRRRVPNRFYGYSSDEEHSHPPSQQRILNKIAISTEPPQLQWNKEDLPSPPTPRVSVPETPPYVAPPIIWNTKVSPTIVIPPVQHTPPPAAVVAPSSSSSESDVPDSDDDEQRLHISQSPITIAPPPTTIVSHPSAPPPPLPHPIMTVPPTVLSLANVPRPAENLYCYCQCPYDEVSEMIACDGKKCAIEWFHFECVGIMVPPKGKWFCPDCRKQTSSQTQQQRPEYFMSQ